MFRAEDTSFGASGYFSVVGSFVSYSRHPLGATPCGKEILCGFRSSFRRCGRRAPVAAGSRRRRGPTGLYGGELAPSQLVRASRVVVVIVAVCACAGCSTVTQSPTSTPTSSNSGPAVITRVVSVSSTSQLSDMVRWNVTNKTRQPQLVTCEVLVLNGSTQLGELGPVQLAVAAGATAEQFSEVTTLAGSNAADTAQIVCQKGLTPPTS